MSLGIEPVKYWGLNISFEKTIQSVSVCSGPKNKSEQFGGCFFPCKWKEKMFCEFQHKWHPVTAYIKNTGIIQQKPFHHFHPTVLLSYSYSPPSLASTLLTLSYRITFFMYTVSSPISVSPHFPLISPSSLFCFHFSSALSLSLLIFPQSSQSLQQWNKCTELTRCWLSVGNNAITVFISVTVSPILAWALWKTCFQSCTPVHTCQYTPDSENVTHDDSTTVSHVTNSTRFKTVDLLIRKVNRWGTITHKCLNQWIHFVSKPAWRLRSLHSCR